MTPIRTFLAIPIPDEVRNYLKDYSDPLINRQDRINWVVPENIHITLAFLGETDSSVIDNQAKDIEVLVNKFEPMRMGLTDTGVFPHANSPRVLWIGAMPYDKALIHMAESLKDHLRSKGYELDKRKFQPHITLGRVKSISRNSQFIHEFLSAEVRDMQFQANEIVWYESTLTSAGAVYTELKSFKLKTGGQG